MSRITDLGIDLGTSNVLIYGRNRGIIFKAPAVIALNRDTNAVIAIGEDAHKMLGRAPGSIIVKRPLKGGIAGKNLALVGAMLLHFVIEANGKHIFQGPRVIMSVPPALNETERRAITASLFESGARRTQIISRPIAAALGADLPIGETYGEMIVDIGGSITDIAVISMGACVINESLPIGGDSFDEAIIRYVRRKHNLLIGEITAEEIKTRIGSVMPRRDPLYLDITGRDLLSGLPKTLRITSDEVLEALDDPLQELIEVIHSVLERTPAELADRHRLFRRRRPAGRPERRCQHRAENQLPDRRFPPGMHRPRLRPDDGKIQRIQPLPRLLPKEKPRRAEIKMSYKADIAQPNILFFHSRISKSGIFYPFLTFY